MTDIIWITLLGHIVLPVGMILWVAAGSRADPCESVLKLAAAVAYGVLLAVVGVWLLLPPPVWWGYAAGMVVAAAAGCRPRRQAAPNPRGGTALRRLSAAGLAAVCIAATGVAWIGYSPPSSQVVALASPLAPGSYAVLNGGYSILINPHMKTLHRSELAAFRGQSYALDIVKVDGWGCRANGLLPQSLEDYFIFGVPVYAPCAGVVAAAEDGIPDRDPTALEKRSPAGNFVLLECGGAQVLLAHLMQGSVAVARGERVQTGQPLARVGNSGWSSEPHLHLHAQTVAAAAGAPFDADPLPLRVDGRTLVRGSRLEVAGPPHGRANGLP